MKGKERRWKIVALLAVGIAIGVSMTATPAVSHVAGWAHNWNRHIKPRADARYYRKALADARYYNVGETAANATNATNATNAANADNLDGLDATALKTRWAIVEANGTITAQSGSISLAAHNFSGEYYLNLGADVSGKGIIVSPIWRSGASFTGTVSAATCATAGVTCVAAGTNNTSTVYIQTNNAANNAAADHAFAIGVLP